MKTVITYGTFDLLHYGHLNLLKRASRLGDRLIVGVSTDEFCLEKGKKTVFKLEQRMEMVSDLKYVYLAIPEHNMAQKVSDIENDLFKKEPITNITHNVESDSIIKKRTGVIFGVVSFIVAFCVFLWILIPGGAGSPTSSQLEPIRQSSMSVEESFGYYYVTITGSAKNTSNKTMDYVSITFTLYDSAGNVVGTAIDNQSGLGAGETWIYSASGISTTNRPVSWKLTDVTVICY